MRQVNELSGQEKAAILLISIDKGLAADVLRNLKEDEIEKIAYQIARNKSIETDVRYEVLNEFYELCLAHGCISGGGLEYAREVLTEALGAQKCLQVIEKMSVFIEVKPFEFLKEIDSGEILNFLRYERNQTIALVLSYMDPEQAAVILSSVDNERKTDIIKRIALLDKISPDVVEQVEEEVKKKLNNFLGTTNYTNTDGIDIAADILSAVDRGTEKQIFDQLEKDNHEMAENIKKKMFVFEDIVNLDARSIQSVLSKITPENLAMALKATTEEVKDVVLNNISQRAKDILLQEIDMLGMVRLSSVEESQQKIVNMILEMEKNEEIIITKGSGEKLVG